MFWDIFDNFICDYLRECDNMHNGVDPDPDLWKVLHTREEVYVKDLRDKSKVRRVINTVIDVAQAQEQYANRIIAEANVAEAHETLRCALCTKVDMINCYTLPHFCWGVSECVWV